MVLVAGGEMLVRGASKLAAAMRISPLVIGLTVVAFGTSFPELIVSIRAAFAGSADIALGNVVGSNIFNVLFILGLSALITPLLVSSQLIRQDVPVMVLASIVLLLLSLDTRLGFFDGLLLSSGLVVYTYWCVRQAKRESVVSNEMQASAGPRGAIARNLCLCFVGLVLLGFGSKWLVDGSVAVAGLLGVSQLVIGLTIVAAGTSLPEVVTSILAAWRGERDIAVGNVVGSNLFNILGVLGISSLVSPEGISVSVEALRFDLPVMIAVAIACMPIFLTGNVISRWEGALFAFYYVGYTSYLVLAAMSNELSLTLAQAMLNFAIPLTIVTLAFSTYRHMLRSDS